MFQCRRFVDHTTPIYSHNTKVICWRSNADELALELVELASLEERDELLDLVEFSDTRMMFSLAFVS